MFLKDKICLTKDLVTRLASLKRPLVMTNGVFDVLHSGHVSYLHQAAELGATLLVAVNTDASVRMLGKGPDRPLNKAEDRAFVLAGLESIDMVTFFDTYTPVEIIKVIRPEVYVKGGDYDMEKLEETHLVRSWGGNSQAIPFIKGYSTTALVNRIRPSQQTLRKAAFLDRDGVINKDSGYVHRWEDFHFLPGAIEGMQKLQEAGYALVIVTNQSGLARGFYTENQYQELNKSLCKHLSSFGVKLDGIYHCPHHPEGSVQSLSIECHCRKPKPGLLFQAAHELALDMAQSILIGDKQTDIDAARAAGIGIAYSVDSDNVEMAHKKTESDGYFSSLIDCVEHHSVKIKGKIG